MAKQSPKRRLKVLANAIPSGTSTHSLMLALEPQQHAFGDYAIAIIGSGLIEKALEAVILTRLIGLTKEERRGLFDFEANGPLSDLSARIRIAYALGIFGPQTRNDLEHVRTIRNSFAHSMNMLRFETPEVADICALLHTPKTIKQMDRMLLALSEADTPRRRFIETVLILAGRLKGTIATSKSVRLTPKGVQVLGTIGLP